MKPRTLRLPASLAVAIVGVPAAIVLATTSCGGDDSPKDANSCPVFCVEGIGDAGMPPDGGCPVCADDSTGVAVCPMGCTPLG
jgi:hypothetical protein